MRLINVKDMTLIILNLPKSINNQRKLPTFGLVLYDFKFFSDILSKIIYTTQLIFFWYSDNQNKHNHKKIVKLLDIFVYLRLIYNRIF